MSFLRRRGASVHSLSDDEADDPNIDPALRLRTVRTAHSAIAESIRSERRQSRAWLRGKERKPVGSRFFSRPKKGTKEELPADQTRTTGSIGDSGEKAGREKAPAKAGSEKDRKRERRNIYLNRPLPSRERDRNGDPLQRFLRNKVRTTKYTLVTFVPKNLFLQFQRVANIFFLSLIILQLFPIFGAPSGTISMIPLLFILTVTAIKDGIEDYRRGVQDEIVNNSPGTKLCTTDGTFHNPNQPRDPRTFFEKLIGVRKPGSVSKGVKRLRAKEAGDAQLSLRALAAAASDERGESSIELMHGQHDRDIELGFRDRDGRLDDIQSVDSHGHSYPPISTMSTSGDRSSHTLVGPTQSTGSVATSAVGGGKRHQERPQNPPSWERTLWKKLEVGDIVLLREDDQVPADILVLATSDPTGQCFLETKNLDGETNLKMRRATKSTAHLLRSEEDVPSVNFVLDSEGPSAALYEYRAVLRMHGGGGDGEEGTETVGINELLLRGCSLRNTAWVMGLVVFTGGDTKIMMNGGLTPSKRSRIEVETNFNVFVNFGVLVFMCAFSAVMSGVWDWRDVNGMGSSKSLFEQGVDPTSSIALNAVITFASCFIAFQNIVPISLYISIEIVKTIQAYFISQDIQLYYDDLDAPCTPKTWNISDDLGQIEYIFSDKTGTLTQNVMELQRVSINGVAYGEGITEASKGKAMREGAAEEDNGGASVGEKLAARKDAMLCTLERAFKNRYMQPEKLTLISPLLAEVLGAAPKSPLPSPGGQYGTGPGGDQRPAIIAFFRALALCHGVLAAEDDSDGLTSYGAKKLVYKAESPDEAALVSAARDVGFPFVGKKAKDVLEIQVCGATETYTLLRVIEFDSTRKRMSVIVRCPDGRIEMYCKGADSVIYERIARGQEEIKEGTRGDMEKFANEGLRTLCISHRIVGEDEFRNWEREYEDALATTGISEEDREALIDRCTSKMERDLLILGATALEDKLQEGVPESIEQLHRAGIKLWILTGDKLQTAIEIGYSCNLLKPSMDVMILSAASADQAKSQIEAGLNKIASMLGPPTFDDPKKRGFMPGREKASFAVVIDGDTLRYALDEKGGLKSMFLNLGTQCETVVCCRVSPAQKALVVKLVKDGRKAMTLSIGDGANDVAMIQEANIGCGLLGLEGSQAAMSADYAFGQFRFLTKLLLVHGHWSYQRVAEMHSNFFYKNVIWTLAMFWYLPFNSFDATYIYQYTFILLYNVVFTSLPVITLGAFDQDINARAALAYPQLYVRGIRGLEYTRTKFWAYMFDGLYQSAVVFFMPYLVWTFGSAVSWNGKGIESISDFGTTVAVSAIFAANCYVGLNTNYWTVITWIVVWGSSIVMLAWIVIYSFLESTDFIDEVVILFGELTFWTTVVFTVAVALAPRFIIKFLSSAYHPLDKQIVREMWVMGGLKDELGIEHRKPRKNKEGKTSRGLEAAPMFKSPHARSTSDQSQDDYEIVDTVSPGSVPPPQQTYLDSPPNGNSRPGSSQAQYAYATNPQDGHYLSPSPRSPRSPQHSGDPRQHAASPQPSFYSASDLPSPSPLPEPIYRYPSGEITTIPPSRRTSVSRSLATARGVSVRSGGPSSPTSPPIPGHTPYSPDAYHVQPPSPGAYEMETRSPTRSHFERSASAASYATANDDFFTAEDEPVGGDTDVMHSSNYQHQSHPPNRHSLVDDDDTSTVQGHRESMAWGQAL